MRLMYISQGNIPSKWAHTFQAMKMGEAFSKLVPDFQLITQGHWCSFFYPRFDYEEWYGIQQRFEIVRLPVWGIPRQGIMDGVWYPWFDRMARWYVAWKKAHLVFTRSPYAGQLCVQQGLNTIIESHIKINDAKFSHIQAVKNCTHLRGVVTITEELKELYHQVGIPNDKIFVWPDAVDVGAFTHLPDKGTLRRRLKLPEDIFIATYCGHLYPGRGVEDILQCAIALPNVQFLMVGGWEKDIAKRKVESSHLNNVCFIGFVPHRFVPEYLAASDVLLMPYSHECENASWMSPMKLFEYMAARRPIIASDISVFRGILQHGKNAFLVAPDSSKALAHAIGTLSRDKRMASRLAEKACDDVQSYTWDKRARSILENFMPEMVASV